MMRRRDARAVVARWAGGGRIDKRIVSLAFLILLAASAAGNAAPFSHNDEPGGSPALPEGARVLKDVAYGSDSEQRMDVYLPPRATNAPVIFMVHGGAWRFGDKAANGVVENKARRWLARGFILVSANYRLLPKADPVTQAEDVVRALAAAQKAAPSWSGNPAKFIVMGHSAGAHLVDLLAASPGKAGALGARPWLGTISLDSAALNVVSIMASRHYRFYDRAFGTDREFWRAASPLHALAPGAGPILLVCSSLRPDRPCTEARAFADKAAALNVRAEVLELPLSHEEVNATLGLSGNYTDTVEAFMSSLDPAVRKMLEGFGH